MLARCLMIQGTSSHAGKSILVAALCRILAQDGLRVAPFKAQNMALNSYVTRDGGEMGRAQVLQAQAAKVQPSTDMNPILLKPASDLKTQVILRGKPIANLDAWSYHRSKLNLLPHVKEALERLRRSYEVVVIEGAGSPAEVNLKKQDIANMRVAELAEAPVLLVGDIDRGGVFASLVGTLELLERDERERIAGFIINKFRGSAELLGNGLDFLERKTGIPVLGVVPYIHELGLEEEDSVVLDECSGGRGEGGEVEIAVIHLPQLSNFTDFDPLSREPGVILRYVRKSGDIGSPDALILPGTKSTVSDLNYLRRTGLDAVILQLAYNGVPVVGICGGYQMLGREILDPEGVESREKKTKGLGLLPLVTVMRSEKTTYQVRARVRRPIRVLGLDETSPPLEGYEIHMGESTLEGEAVLSIIDRGGIEVEAADGAVHPQLPVFGCYLHGIFENRVAREGFLNFLRWRKGLKSRPSGFDWEAWREDRLDRLARIVRSSLKMNRIYSLLGRDHQAGTRCHDGW